MFRQNHIFLNNLFNVSKLSTHDKININIYREVHHQHNNNIGYLFNNTDYDENSKKNKRY
jgi:hypothetical protein